MKFELALKDLNGTPLTPIDVTASYAAKVSGASPGHVVVDNVFRHLAPGEVLDANLAENRVSFTVEASGFQEEQVVIGESRQHWMSDNAACEVTSAGDRIKVAVTVGTIRLAPTINIPPETPVRDNPGAALVDPDPAGGGIYRGAWLNRETINVLQDPIDIRNPGAVGWERFVYKPVKDIDLKQRGTYVLVHYGEAKSVSVRRRPRFLIAVWAPRVKLAAKPEVMVFYSPPTRSTEYPVDSWPFRKAYPYEPFVTPQPKPVPASELHPPYTGLAVRYLINGYKIIYQLLAAGRNPIVIMPIHPSKNWGPLASQAGLCRLVKEIVRFLYSTQLVSSLATPPGRLSLEGGRASIAFGRGVYTNEKVPDSWAITISGFSNGIDRVLDVCTKETYGKELYALYDPAVFHASPAPLLDSWREIWDIDGVADDGKGAVRHLDTLREWLKKDRRRVRSYHSDTGNLTQPRTLVEASRIETRPKETVKGVAIEQGTKRDERATWVHFSNSVLSFPNPDGTDDDAHHNITKVAFAHAAQFPMP
jgi:hypothetical protein